MQGGQKVGQYGRVPESVGVVSEFKPRLSAHRLLKRLNVASTATPLAWVYFLGLSFPGNFAVKVSTGIYQFVRRSTPGPMAVE